MGDKMREVSLGRLSNTKNSKSSLYYLHYKSFHKELFKAIENFSKGAILDIGCGNKPYEYLFSEHSTEYVGCDIVQSDLNKVDILSPANNIPLGNDTFDTVFSTQTIEHVEDYQGLLDEAYRILKQDCYLILSGPFNWQLHEEPYDFFRFSKYGFIYILEKSGFEIVSIKENGGMWAVVGQYILKNLNNDHKDRKKSIRRTFFLLKKLKIINILNIFFDWLDRADHNTINTINYVIVARKNCKLK